MPLRFTRTGDGELRPWGDIVAAAFADGGIIENVRWVSHDSVSVPTQGVYEFGEAGNHGFLGGEAGRDEDSQSGRIEGIVHVADEQGIDGRGTGCGFDCDEECGTGSGRGQWGESGGTGCIPQLQPSRAPLSRGFETRE